MSEEPTPTPRMQRLNETAARLARRYGHAYVGTEHMLLAFLNEDGGIGPGLIREYGDAQAMERAVIAILEAPPEEN